MSLDAFFGAMGPFLQGRSSVDDLQAALGPSSSSGPDLAFYPWLVAVDQRRILAELCPTAKTLVDRTEGLSWDALVADYVVACPPTGISVPGVGERLADWLTARRADHPEQPVALECLVDLYWTRFLARTAPDVDGVGLDQRLFVRHYPVDVLAVERALLDAAALPEERPCTLIVFRHVTTLDVRHLQPSLVTLAVLAQRQGEALQGPLAQLGPEVLAGEARRLDSLGVLPEQAAG